MIDLTHTVTRNELHHPTGRDLGHVLEPHVGRKRIDGSEIQFVDVDGVLPVDSRAALRASLLVDGRLHGSVRVGAVVDA